MGGYSLNPIRLREELALTKMEYFDKFLRGKLTWQEEAVYLERIDMLKKDLECLKDSTS